MLKIENLHVAVEDKKVVKGVSLKIKPGEIHTIMGPNGSGKSSLAYGLMGHPSYRVISHKSSVMSRIVIDGDDMLEKSPDELAKAGLFLAFQHPISIPGVSVSNFLRIARQSLMEEKNSNSKGKHLKTVAQFNKELNAVAKKLGIKAEFLKRGLNEGFSGGEKKKLEMLQLATLKPKYAIIDEIDTGLDVDALKLVAKGIKEVVSKNKTGILLITHYQRILHYLKPDYVHVMINGNIVETGSAGLAEKIEKQGYKKYV
jgi:Fe-S cluster assembly ATP-binding protein